MRYQKGERTINEQEIKDALKQDPIQSAASIAKHIGKTQPTVKRFCDELTDQGKLKRTTWGNKHTMNLYELESDGHKPTETT